MAEMLVTVLDAGRTYPPQMVALASATCRIEPGARIALVGPSGSGKSTLLHLMSGLDTPTSGSVSWPALGKRESLRPAQVACVFQSPSLIPALSVVENVALPLLLNKMSPREARQAALDILARLNLNEIAEKLPEELSGGQAQRVAVARAMVVKPRLILADEPTGQLDRATADHLFDIWLAALADSATAVVVATHDMAIANRLGVQWRIDHGRLETQV